MRLWYSLFYRGCEILCFDQGNGQNNQWQELTDKMTAAADQGSDAINQTKEKESKHAEKTQQKA